MSGQNLQEDPLAEISSSEPAASPLGTEQLMTRYNMRSPAVKRILREAAEMAQHDKTILDARPLEDNIFEWHFTFRGPPETVYARGIYHGRLILPSQYPMSPPEVVMMTPSGRFETGTRICLSISNYHPETWQPSWSIRTAIMALQSFMATNSPGAIGSVECADNVRTALALNSPQYDCIQCGVIEKILDPIEKQELPSTSSPSDPTTTPQKPLLPPGPQGVRKFRMPSLANDTEERPQLADGSDARAGDSNPPAEGVERPLLEEDEDPDVIPIYGSSLDITQYEQGHDALSWAIGFIMVLIGGIVIRRMWTSYSP